MKKEKQIKIKVLALFSFLVLILCLVLSGCNAHTETTMDNTVEHEPATKVEPKAMIGGKGINIPQGYIVAHTPFNVRKIGVDKDSIYFSLDSKRDCAYIRYSQTTTPIKNIEAANRILLEYNLAEYFNNSQLDNTVAKEVGLLNNGNTYFLQALAMDNDGISYYVNSFVNKGSCDLYSVIFVYDEDMNTDCSDEFIKSLCKDMDNIMYEGAEESERGKEFTSSALSTLRLWTNEKELQAESEVIRLSEITEATGCELRSGVVYVLDSPNGLYSFESVEGAGGITLIDSRFLNRRLLIGYNSENAPPTYEGVALVNGEQIIVEGNVLVRFRKKIWKEI